MDIKKKRLEFLEDTIQYYSENVERRCTLKGRCTYSPVNVGKQDVSEGCAIGRHMTPANAVKADLLKSSYEGAVSAQFIATDAPELLPNDMLKLGGNFLRAAQGLHDDDRYWFLGGLTDTGKKQYKWIVTLYC